MCHSPFQVGVHIVKAVVFGQVHQHSRRAAAFSGPAEAAVTDPSAWWALPLLPRTMRMKWVTRTMHTYTEHSTCLQTYRIQQSISDLFSIAVTKTRPAELTPDAHALRTTAVSFGVDCLLAALVASGSLKRKEVCEAELGCFLFVCFKLLKCFTFWVKDLQWSCCRLSLAHCGRCAAAPSLWCPPQASLHGGWPCIQWRIGDGAAHQFVFKKKVN